MGSPARTPSRSGSRSRSHQRELHEHDVPQEIDEPRAARPRAAIDVEHPEQLPISAWSRGSKSNEGGSSCYPPDLDRVVVGEPVRGWTRAAGWRGWRAGPFRVASASASFGSSSSAPSRPWRRPRSAPASPHRTLPRSTSTRGSAPRGAPPRASSARGAAHRRPAARRPHPRGSAGSVPNGTAPGPPRICLMSSIRLLTPSPGRASPPAAPLASGPLGTRPARGSSRTGRRRP